MTTMISAVSPPDTFGIEDPLPGFLRRLGFDGGPMAATDKKSEEGVDPMQEDDGLPDAFAASDSGGGAAAVREHGGAHTMVSSSGRMPRTLT